MRRRRGRDSRQPELLLERDAEQALIEQRLDDAVDGHGSVTVIEGPPGTGKSRLVHLAGDLARRRDVTVLGAYGAELERDFPFGVAIQLFEPWWLSAGLTAREGVAGNGAGAAARLLAQGPARSDSDDAYATIHGLFRLAANIAEADAEPPARPVLMLVDDAHWVDGPSLRSLAYLATRLSHLPIAMIVASRTGESATDPRALAALRAAAGTSLVRLATLSAAAVEALVHAEFPAADDAFCHACEHATSGNPFLIIELLEQVRDDGLPPDGGTAARLEGLAPEAVLDAVVARLGAQPPAVGAVARAASILGDGASLRVVARLAGLPVAEVVQAADALSEMHLFCPGEPLSFIHPLIRGAVEQSMSPLDRGLAHLRAARILDEDAVHAEAIAPHLLAAPPEADPRVAVILRDAARVAVGSGAPDSAVRMLRRAFAEGAAADQADLLAELAEAEAAAGLGDAVGRLEQAIGAVQDPQRRGQLALTQGTVLHRGRDPKAAAGVLKRALDDLTDQDSPLAQDLAAAYVSAASLVPELTDDTQAAADRLLGRPSDDLTARQRAAIAHLALHHARSGQPRPAVRRLADRGWSHGALLGEPGESESSWPLISGALFSVDELERDLELCDVALAHAAARGSDDERAIASLCRGWALYERGEITAAAEAAQAAVDAQPLTGPTFSWTAYGAIALCHLQQGRLDDAETALAIIEHPELMTGSQRPPLMVARARLRLAQRQPEAALSDAVAAGQWWESAWGPCSATALAWRSIAAQAQLALGRRAQAHDLASEELAAAQSSGATRIVIRALRVLGLVEGGQGGLEHLQSAVRLGNESPPRLEHIAALIALGGLLRRANQRAAARAPLLEAIKLSQMGGATALAHHAQEELAATGARPRTTAQWGPEALTPSERRVADLAADGLTTRQISESLFVTPKTVEFHLRHIYQKLGVNSRDRLSGALRDTG